MPTFPELLFILVVSILILAAPQLGRLGDALGRLFRGDTQRSRDARDATNNGDAPARKPPTDEQKHDHTAKAAGVEGSELAEPQAGGD